MLTHYTPFISHITLKLSLMSVGQLLKLCSKFHNCKYKSSELWDPIPSFTCANFRDCLWHAMAIGRISSSQYFSVDLLMFSFSTGRSHDLSRFSSPFGFFKVMTLRTASGPMDLIAAPTACSSSLL